MGSAQIVLRPLGEKLRSFFPLPHQDPGPGAGDVHREPLQLRKLGKGPTFHQLRIDGGAKGSGLHSAGGKSPEKQTGGDLFASGDLDLPDEE